MSGVKFFNDVTIDGKQTVTGLVSSVSAAFTTIQLNAPGGSTTLEYGKTSFDNLTAGNLANTNLTSTNIHATSLTATSLSAVNLSASQLKVATSANIEKLAIGTSSSQSTPLYVVGDAVIYGSLTAVSGATFQNTTFTTTSAISVLNTGTSTALIVQQTGEAEIARFVDHDTGTFVVIDGHTDRPGYVGIRVAQPTEALTVSGNISATGNMTAVGNVDAGGQILSGGTDLASIFFAGGPGDINLSSLSDVAINLGTIANGQALKYDSALSAWTNQTDLSGSNATIYLSALSGDVSITSAASGQALVYDSATSKWKNTGLTIANTSGLQAALDAKAPLSNPAFSGALTVTQSVSAPALSGTHYGDGSRLTGIALTGLNDIQVAGVTDGQVLKYNASTSKWTNQADASGSAANIYLSALTGDVDVASITNGQALVYDTASSKWKNQTLSASNITNFTTAVVAAASANLIPQLSATNVYATSGIFTYISGDGSKITGVTASGGTATDATKLPLTGGTLTGNLFVSNAGVSAAGLSGTLYGSASNLTNLSLSSTTAWNDVALASPTNRQVLVYDTTGTTKWKNQSLSASDVSNFTAAAVSAVSATTFSSLSASKFYGDGSSLTGIVTSVNGLTGAVTNVVTTSGATLTGNLILSNNSSLTATNGTFTGYVSAPALSGTYYGSGVNLTGVVTGINGTGPTGGNIANVAKIDSSNTFTANQLISSPNYLSAGGTIYSGNVYTPSISSTTGTLTINSNLAINGQLSALSAVTFVSTQFTTTSSLCVVNPNPIGNSPSLYIGSRGSGDVASFYDLDGPIEMLHIGGLATSNPNVGVKTSTPNKDLTVAGEFSASNHIWTGGNVYATAVSAQSLTATTAIFSTSVSSQNISGTHYGSGANLTGVVAAGVFYASGGTLTGASAFLNVPTLSTQTLNTTSVSSTTVSASNFYGNGGSITGINAGNVSAGTLPNGRLPAVASFTTSVSAPAISAVNFYGGGANLTGVVASTLPAVGTFSTSVSAPAISAVNFYGNLAAGVSTKSSTFTLALSDAGSVIRLGGASAFTTIIPTNASVPFPIGTQTIIAQVSAATASVSATTGVTLLSYQSKTALAAQNSVASLIKTDTNEWLLAGDIN